MTANSTWAAVRWLDVRAKKFTAQCQEVHCTMLSNLGDGSIIFGGEGIILDDLELGVKVISTRTGESVLGKQTSIRGVH
jgi:hypothetical protein